MNGRAVLPRPLVAVRPCRGTMEARKRSQRAREYRGPWQLSPSGSRGPRVLPVFGFGSSSSSRMENYRDWREREGGIGSDEYASSMNPMLYIVCLDVH